MLDPCLFHATIFSASATIDRLKSQDSNLITIYHQTWAIRLLNERLNQETPVLGYDTLGSVVPYILHNVRISFKSEANSPWRCSTREKIATNEKSDGGVRQGFGDSSPEGPYKDAAVDTETA